MEKLTLRVERWNDRENQYESVATLFKYQTSLAEIREFIDDFMTNDTYEIEVLMRRR